MIDTRGIFCALYSDRGSHFFVTPKAGGKVDPNQLTQLGRALQDLGIKMIPAYSPQARGRMERSYRTWQGRLPQELRIRKIQTVEKAHRFLREQYRAEFYCINPNGIDLNPETRALTATEAVPIMVGGLLYSPTVHHSIVALDQANGKEVWKYDLGADEHFESRHFRSHHLRGSVRPN